MRVTGLIGPERVLAVLLALFFIYGGHLSAAQSDIPVISIIIDDIGYRHIDDVNALALPGPVAYAIMPHSPYAVKMSELAARSGKDIILHMPMEAIEVAQNRFLGPGGLTLDMNEARFVMTMVHNLRSVPNIIGVNNHMGSLLSMDRERMGWLMDYLHVKKIFYIDSVTIGNSYASQAARNRDVPYLRRDVFLDNSINSIDINSQFDELIRVARRKGSAIAIGHPHPQTIEVLNKNLDRLPEYGVRLIGLKDMLTIQQPTEIRKVSMKLPGLDSH